MFEQEIAIDAPQTQMTVFMAWPEGADTLPGVIVYMDVFGLREEIFDFARRFASEGYAAFVPDLFHRLPVTRFPPANEKGSPLSPEVNHANEVTTLAHSVEDTAALLRYVDQACPVAVNRFGTVGYCMGGRHALAAGNAFPDRIPAVASLHAGKLVNETPVSPHRLLATYPGEVYFAYAKRDPTCPDEHKAIVSRALAEGPAEGHAEHLDAYHGWSFPTRWAYDKKTDDAVWQTVLLLFERRLG